MAGKAVRKVSRWRCLSELRAIFELADPTLIEAEVRGNRVLVIAKVQGQFGDLHLTGREAAHALTLHASSDRQGDNLVQPWASAEAACYAPMLLRCQFRRREVRRARTVLNVGSTSPVGVSSLGIPFTAGLEKARTEG